MRAAPTMGWISVLVSGKKASPFSMGGHCKESAVSKPRGPCQNRSHQSGTEIHLQPPELREIFVFKSRVYGICCSSLS